jgi:hypothetical protein
MISKLGEDPTELDMFAAKAVPGTMYLAGTDTVSEVLRGKVHVVFQTFS